MQLEEFPDRAESRISLLFCHLEVQMNKKSVNLQWMRRRYSGFDGPRAAPDCRFVIKIGADRGNQRARTNREKSWPNENILPPARDRTDGDRDFTSRSLGPDTGRRFRPAGRCRTHSQRGRAARWRNGPGGAIPTGAVPTRRAAPIGHRRSGHDGIPDPRVPARG